MRCHSIQERSYERFEEEDEDEEEEEDQEEEEEENVLDDVASNIYQALLVSTR